MLPHRDFWGRTFNFIKEYTIIGYERVKEAYDSYFNVDGMQKKEFVTKKIDFTSEKPVGYGSTEIM